MILGNPLIYLKGPGLCAFHILRLLGIVAAIPQKGQHKSPIFLDADMQKTGGDELSQTSSTKKSRFKGGYQNLIQESYGITSESHHV
jgi:hypothetical protein